MNFLKIMAIGIFMLLNSNIGLALDHQYSDFGKLLKKYVAANGDVNYKKWKSTEADYTKIKDFKTELEKVTTKEFKSFSKAQQKAFFINAYNGLTVLLILDHYPVKSIKKIGGLATKPWSIKFFKILGGSVQTLDAIEHDVLRKKYPDPRIHSAVNCASVGCPKLFNKPFLASKLEAQMDLRAKDWLNDKSQNSFDVASGTANISSIFTWFKEDFGNTDEGVRKFLVKYGPKAAKDLYSKNKEFKFTHIKYNWDLNKQ